MKPRFSILAIFCLLSFAPAHADIAVIVNVNNPLQTISQNQVIDLYLGRSRSFPAGEYALVFDHPLNAKLRDRFFYKLTGMTPNQVSTYWSRLMFSGQVLPPRSLNGSEEVLNIVSRNAGAIGYVESDQLDGNPNVKVILTILLDANSD